MKKKIKLYTPLIFDKYLDLEDIEFLFYHTEIMDFIPSYNTVPVLRNFRFDTVIEKTLFEKILLDSNELSQINFSSSYQYDENNRLRNMDMCYLCYDEIGAFNYAEVIKSKFDVSNYQFLMLEAEFDISKLFISPYDYLFNQISSIFSNAKRIHELQEIFGEKIEFYIDILKETKRVKKETIFEIMCKDEEPILAHSQNKNKIKSNLGFDFCHSFFSYEYYNQLHNTDNKLFKI